MVYRWSWFILFGPILRSQILHVWSSLPVATWWPFGENSADSTASTCPLRVLTHLPVRRSHTLPMASRPQDTARDPSHWKPTLYTSLLCPSCSSRLVPVSQSHSLQVLSKDAVATAKPRGSKATLPSRPVCPSRVRRSFPDADHSLAVESLEAVHTLRDPPSDEAEALGWIATPVIRLSPWASTLASFFRPSDRHTLNLPLQLPVTRSSPQVDTQQSEMGLSSPNSLQSSATSLAHAASSALDLLAASLPTSAFATLRRSLALFSDAVATFRRCSSSAAVPSV
mmetsp:Transcript_7754/g.26697  ORF Transcript_7754/g.26697 Transcript_7754/m.26697 type:complete len:283 (+) Transcript_7754:783-1631(+)